MTNCPLRAVDQRLSDSHQLWHIANNSYFDPNAFRINVQNLIQSLRTVSSFKDLIENHFKQARKVFLKDEHHLPIAFFTSGNKVIEIMAAPVEDRQDKYMLSRQFAVIAQKINADGFFFIGEMWSSSSANEKDFQYPVDMLDRKELLSLYSATSKGDLHILASDILRAENTPLALGETHVGVKGIPYFLAPLFRLWNIELPKLE